LFQFKNLKPGVPKRALLFIAAMAWSIAALILFWRGHFFINEAHFPVSWGLYISISLGFMFYLLLFSRISLSHSNRIFKLTVDKPCAFAFFSVKSYVMMIIMIAAGIFLRKTGAVNPVIIAVFYWIMGVPLLLSSFRFWYFGLNYSAFQRQFQERIDSGNPHLSRWQKRLANFVSVTVVLLILLITYSNYEIARIAKPYIYSSVDEVPFNNVAVVPGTSSKLSSGHKNLFFTYRLKAVSELYRQGKINAIIVSGDNGTVYYNEPMDMKKALVELQIPDSVIYLDYAGFRTFDSVIRAWKIFGQKKFTFVSQRFQNERAVFIGRSYGIEIIAYNAQDVTTYSSFKTMVRELFARVKVFLDIYVLNQQPRFLGEPVIIK